MCHMKTDTTCLDFVLPGACRCLQNGSRAAGPKMAAAIDGRDFEVSIGNHGMEWLLHGMLVIV